MGKVFWFDCETTGLDPEKNAIIQLAALIEIDGEIKEELELKLRPFARDEISQDALDIHGYSEDEIKQFPSPQESITQLKGTMGKYVDKFNKNDKFVMAGYYVAFDSDFLRSLFEKIGDYYFGSWFFSVVYDVQGLVAKQIIDKDFRAPNYKLSTICEKFGIEIQAHDALSDIRATRDLSLRIGS